MKFTKGPESGNLCDGKVTLAANKNDLIRNLGFLSYPIQIPVAIWNCPLREMTFFSLDNHIYKISGWHADMGLCNSYTQNSINTDHLTPMNKLSKISWGPY